MASKPYVASGKYIDRMSNHCKGCRYDPAQATGDKSLQFDVRKLNFIGNPVVTNNVMVVWHTSGVKTMADAKATPAWSCIFCAVIFGAMRKFSICW